jgi:hypothetical protein
MVPIWIKIELLVQCLFVQSLAAKYAKLALSAIRACQAPIWRILSQAKSPAPKMSEQEILAKLADIVARLERIEKRQIAVREEIKESAPAVTGSFASTSDEHQ